MPGMGKTSKGINYDIIRPDKQSKKAPLYNKGGRVGKQLGGAQLGGAQLGGAEGNTRPITGTQRFDQPGMGMRGGLMYNKGGRVLRDKGTPKSGEKGFKHKGTLQKINKKIFGKNRKRYDEQAAKTDVHHPAVIRELKKKGLTSKKVKEDILKEEMKSYNKGGKIK